MIVSAGFKNACDSVKREEIIEVMIRCKIHPNIIHAVSEVYQGDTTILQIGDHGVEMQVTSGIKQGCTTAHAQQLFYLIT